MSAAPTTCFTCATAVTLSVALATLACASRTNESPSAQPGRASAESPEPKEANQPTPNPTPDRLAPKSQMVAARLAADSEPDRGTDWWDDDTFFDPEKEPLGIVVDNRCSDAVYLFFGQSEPDPDANYYTSINGRAQSFDQMMPGDKVWLLDERRAALDSTTVNRETTTVIIDPDCNEIYAE